MNMKKILQLTALALPALLALSTGNAVARDASEPGLYATGMLGYDIAVSGGAPRVDLGGGVSSSGSADYRNGPAGSLAIGREFVSKNDDEEPKHYRLEAELWMGKLQRTSITIDGTPNARNDAINAQALFANALYRVYRDDKYRGWLGLGIGWGRVDVPSAQDAFPGCDCFGAKTVDGLAYRLKLQVQRDISESSAVFAELGYVRLPAGSTGGLSATHYGALGVASIGVGFERRF